MALLRTGAHVRIEASHEALYHGKTGTLVAVDLGRPEHDYFEVDLLESCQERPQFEHRDWFWGYELVALDPESEHIMAANRLLIQLLVASEYAGYTVSSEYPGVTLVATWVDEQGNYPYTAFCEHGRYDLNVAAALAWLRAGQPGRTTPATKAEDRETWKV